MECIYNANGYADGIKFSEIDKEIMALSPEHAKIVMESFVQFRKNELDAHSADIKTLSDERRDYTTKQFELSKSYTFGAPFNG